MTTEEIDHYNELHLIHTYALAALAKAISFTLAMADNPKIGPNMTWSAMLAESAPNRAKRARRREDAKMIMEAFARNATMKIRPDIQTMLRVIDGGKCQR
ncbi:MAG: hypothetical protein ABI846_03460 [Rudaea sp.]